jgi:ethanolamine ammonia-lyase small subunit
MADVDWDLLRARTQARIGLGRRGHALPTKEHLDFQEAHARARDAIWTPWDHQSLERAIRNAGTHALVVASQVNERRAYLLNPNAGRSLAERSARELEQWRSSRGPSPVVVLVSDGLSAHAMHAQGHTLTASLVSALREHAAELGSLGPVVLAPFGRVALSDAVGAALGASLVIHVIGERPGLSAVDSVALYVTYAPRLGNTDAERNCISNIREPHGLTHAEGIRKALFLAQETKRLGYGGYRVKDGSGEAVLAAAEVPGALPPPSQQVRSRESR